MNVFTEDPFSGYFNCYINSVVITVCVDVTRKPGSQCMRFRVIYGVQLIAEISYLGCQAVL